jgi:hypothetical protein
MRFNKVKMKKLIIIYTLLLPAFFSEGQVFIGTVPTENPVLLEVASDTMGVLIPRINIPDTLLSYPVTNPQDGLFVMNTHPGKEGLYFWNGTAWEKMKIEETAMAEFENVGKKNIFVGVEKGDVALTKNLFVSVPLKASLGTVTSDSLFLVPENGIYEVTANFSGKPVNQQGYVILNIRNYTQQTSLAYTTINQGSGYQTIATKAIYCGPLQKNDRIGLRIRFGSTESLSATETLKKATLAVKKLNVK